MHQKHQGFTYEFTHKRNGVVIDTWKCENIVPAEGLDYIIGAAFIAGVAKISNWYAGLWSGAYVPQSAATAATLQSLVTETTAYADTNRPAFAPTAASSGAVTDAHQYVFTGSGTINGAFVSSSSAKNGGDGVLVSVVRFDTARAFVADDIIEVRNTVDLN